MINSSMKKIKHRISFRCSDEIIRYELILILNKVSVFQFLAFAIISYLSRLIFVEDKKKCYDIVVSS